MGLKISLLALYIVLVYSARIGRKLDLNKLEERFVLFAVFLLLPPSHSQCEGQYRTGLMAPLMCGAPPNPPK
jgi:hypothetical protein